MNTSAPLAPGRLGVAAQPSQMLTYLGELDRWLTERRAELDALDAQILAGGRTELTADMALAMALWQAAKSRQGLILSAWDSGRVGQQELEKLSALVWGRLESPAAQLQSMTVSLPEAGRLNDALVAQLRTKLNTDPSAEQAQIRLRDLRAQLERLRDQLQLEPPALLAVAQAKQASLATRVEELDDKRERGGDIAGLLGPLEADAARFERDLIVGAAQRRQARDLLARTREQFARAQANHQAVTALADRARTDIGPAPAVTVPDLGKLGPLPNTAAALAEYAETLTAYERELDQAYRSLSQAVAEVDALTAQLPALQAKAEALGLAGHPDLRDLGQLIERRLAERPMPIVLVQQLLAGFTTQLTHLQEIR